MDEKMILTLAFFVLVIVIVGVGNDMLQRWLKHKERTMELMASQTAEKAAQYAAHVERLEQRMRVLERIATDRGVGLAAQIEDLRDEPAAKEQLQ